MPENGFKVISEVSDYNEEQHEQNIKEKHEELKNQLNLTLIAEEYLPK